MIRCYNQPRKKKKRKLLWAWMSSRSFSGKEAILRINKGKAGEDSKVSNK